MVFLPDVKALLRRKGISQRFVADYLGVTQGFVSQIVNGHKNPTVRTLARLADVLNCDVVIEFRPRA